MDTNNGNNTPGAAGGDLFSMLQQMNPEMLQKMVEAGLFDERSRPLQQRFGLGNEMLNSPSPQGRTVGSTYVASSPLEHAASAIRQVMGARMAQQSMAGENALATQRGQGRSAYLNAILQALQNRNQPPDPNAPIEPGTSYGP